MSSSARSWGCAGVVALALSACATTSLPPAPVARSASVEMAVAPVPEVEAMPVAPEGFDGPPAPAVPPALPAGPAEGGTWAVVVGIDDYPGGGHDLRSAGNDADDMDALLARAGVAPERRLRLRDGQATADVLRRSLDWLVARAGPGSTAVFFFAGHVRRVGGTTEAMVGADGRLVADREVARRLAGLRAARTWLVVAACYGGGFVEALGPGRILTAAAPADRLAYENLALRRSYLVEYVIRRALLEGRAPASVESAFAWAEAEVRREHPGRVPVQFDRLDGDFDLSLAAPLAARAASPRPAPPPARPQPSPTTTTTAPRQDEGCGITVGTLVHCPDA